MSIIFGIRIHFLVRHGVKVKSRWKLPVSVCDDGADNVFLP